MNAITEKPALAPTVQQSQRPGRSPRRLRRALRPIAATVFIVGAAITGAWWLTEGRWIESTDNAYVQGDIAVLSPRIDGEVAAILVGDNQAVHAGDKLIQLDPTDWQARLDQARASVTEADATIATIYRQISQQQAAVRASQAAIDQAEAERVRAAADAERSSTLASRGWASKQADELAVATNHKAAAAVASAVAQKSASEEQLTVLAAQVTQAQARRLNAVAAAKLADNNLSYTVIRAPFDGTVGNRAAQPGQHVVPGTQLIAVTPNADRLFVVANFKETQLRRMQAGMKVRLVPDINPNAAVEGRIDSLAPATGSLFSLLPPENATGNFTKIVQRVPVKVTIPADQVAHATWLRAGLSVTAEADTRGPDAIRLGWFGAAVNSAWALVP